MALGEKYKIIEKNGNSYFFIPPPQTRVPNPNLPPTKGEEKIKLGVGYDSTRTFLKSDKKISEQILKEIRRRFQEEAS